MKLAREFRDLLSLILAKVKDSPHYYLRINETIDDVSITIVLKKEN